MLLAGFSVMLTSIDFYNKLGRGNIEIDNVRTNHLLSMYHNREVFEEIIPKVPFFLGHMFTQGASIFSQFGVVCFIHSCLLLGNRLASVWGMKQAATKESI